jgi:hypothetical protein
MSTQLQMPSRAKLSCVTRSAGLLGAGLLGLWVLLEALLASDRGLDLTDEGLYLLAADPPSRVAAWGTPWGWHTSPLLRLVSGDVANFRTLGAVLLVAASAALAVAVASGRWRMPDHTAEVATRLESTLAGVAGGLGGYLYYAGMLRTPSYNWVVIIGTVIAATGTLLNLPPSRHRMPRFGLALTAFGLFVTIPAKPTSSILFGLALGLLIWRRVGLQQAVRHVLTLSIATSAFIILAVALRVWPSTFYEVFLTALAMPTPSDGQTLLGGVLGYLRLPDTIVRMAPGAVLAVAIVLVALRVPAATLSVRSRLAWAGGATLLIGFLWVALRALTIAVYEERTGLLDALIQGRALFPLEHYLTRAFRLWLTVASVVLVSLAAFAGGIRQRRWSLLLLLVGMAAFEAEIHQSVLLGGEGKVRFVLHGTTTAMLMLISLGLLALVESGRSTDGSTEHRRLAGGVIGVVGFLTAVAFSTSFGSGHGPYRQTALAAVLLVSAALIATMSVGKSEHRRLPLALIVSTLLVLSASITADNWAKPYRTAPILENTVAMQVGPRLVQLRLDPTTADVLRGLLRSAEESGWRAGAPLLSVVDPWHSTLPYVLGARVPDSLMLTLGGKGQLLDWNLERLDRSEFQAAWLLVSKPGGPDPTSGGRQGDRDTPEAAVAKVVARSGTTFPDDYVLVHSVPEAVKDPNLRVELWRPR